MDHRAGVRAAAALTLVPALVVAPAIGAAIAAALALLAPGKRRAPSREALRVLGAVVTVIVLLHGAVSAASALVLLLAWSGVWTLGRLDATTTRATAHLTGVGAAALAFGMAITATISAATSGFSQVAVATHHPNATAALALVLVAGSCLAWGATSIRKALALAGILGALVVLVLSGSRGGLVGLLATFGMGVVIVLAARLLAARSRRVAVAGIVLAACGLLVFAQFVFVAPDRVLPWWPSVWSQTVERLDAGGREGGWPLAERLRQLEQPLGTSGGRLAAWKLAREMIAQRPLAGYGFDAVETVYANGAQRDLADPLAHPHHGFLTMLLQGGALLLVAAVTVVVGFTLRLARRAVEGDVVATVTLAVAVGLAVMEMLDSVLRFGNVGGPFLVVTIMAASAWLPRDDEDRGLPSQIERGKGPQDVEPEGEASGRP